MCIFIKKKQMVNKRRISTIEEIEAQIERERRAYEKLYEWEYEQFASGNGQKLLNLQAAIEKDVMEIFGECQR